MNTNGGKSLPGTDQHIAGFPSAGDIKERKCKKEASFSDDCVNKPGESGIDSGAAWGCDAGLKCCLYPATAWKCANNYVGNARTTIQETTCVPTEAQCTSPNFKMDTGAGCTAENGGLICCAVVKSGAGGAAGKKTTGAIPQTGSTAEWLLQNKAGTGIQLVSCTKDGNCTIGDIVQQGINFAKWLIGLAGALFLVVFVYGGAMYLASFGNQAWVTKGKTALTRGAIGIVLVMGAWTIIAYVAQSLGYTPVTIGGQTDQTDKCKNDDTASRGCVATSDNCQTWCKQIYGASTGPGVDVSKNCSEGPAGACSANQKCCVLTK